MNLSIPPMQQRLINEFFLGVKRCCLVNLPGWAGSLREHGYIQITSGKESQEFVRCPKGNVSFSHLDSIEWPTHIAKQWQRAHIFPSSITQGGWGRKEQRTLPRASTWLSLPTLAAVDIDYWNATCLSICSPVWTCLASALSFCSWCHLSFQPRLLQPNWQGFFPVATLSSLSYQSSSIAFLSTHFWNLSNSAALSLSCINSGTAPVLL